MWLGKLPRLRKKGGRGESRGEERDVAGENPLVKSEMWQEEPSCTQRVINSFYGRVQVAYVVYGAVGYELLSITAAVNLLLAFANRDAFYAPIYHHPVMVLLLWFIFAIQWGAFAFCLFIVTSSNT